MNHVRRTREAHPRKTLIAGNVVTGEMVEELILSGADIVKVRWHHYLEMIWQYYNTYHLNFSSLHLILSSALLSYCVFLSQRCLHHIWIVQLLTFSNDCHEVMTEDSSLLLLNLKKSCNVDWIFIIMQYDDMSW